MDKCPKCDGELQPNVEYDVCPTCDERLDKTSAYLSNFRTVAIGELQQPGGIGATQVSPHSLGTEPEPDNAFDAHDNAGNSFEQSVAFATWVNYAIDHLNRGEAEEQITAMLAHDGCPDPATVMKHAMDQPFEQADPSAEGTQDPFEVPFIDETANGGNESVERQPPVNPSVAHVRVANTSLTGVEIERWGDMWGNETVKIALDGGGTIDVAPTAVVPLAVEPKHPLSEIQEFINNIPEVEATRPSIQARLENLETLRRAVRSHMSKVSFSDQITLEGWDLKAKDEALELRDFLSQLTKEGDTPYLHQLPRYMVNAVPIPGLERSVNTDQKFVAHLKEKAAVFVHDLPEAMKKDPGQVAYAAMRFAEMNNAGEEIFHFVELVKEQL